MFIDGRNVSLWMEVCERRKSKHIVAAEKCRNWTIDNIKHTCTDEKQKLRHQMTLKTQNTDIIN